MKRRDFLYSASAAAASCLASHPLHARKASAPISGTLTIDESTTLATIPQDFIGLSYESAQLANPAFFSAENTALIALFRELSDQGVLRLGGGTSEFTAFTTEEPPAAAPFDAVGPDTSKNVKSDTPITPRSLRNLRAFLDAAGWRCLYGLNLGRGPVARAAEEAFHVQKHSWPAPHRIPARQRAGRMAQSLPPRDVVLRRLLEGMVRGARRHRRACAPSQIRRPRCVEQDGLRHRLCRRREAQRARRRHAHLALLRHGPCRRARHHPRQTALARSQAGTRSCKLPWPRRAVPACPIA